jgi:hypothetical protein
MVLNAVWTTVSLTLNFAHTQKVITGMKMASEVQGFQDFFEYTKHIVSYTPV